MPRQSGNPDQIGTARGQSSARIGSLIICGLKASVYPKLEGQVVPTFVGEDWPQFLFISFA
jgi:hypothetical protein